jgi:hypothetical protein
MTVITQWRTRQGKATKCIPRHRGGQPLVVLR